MKKINKNFLSIGLIFLFAWSLISCNSVGDDISKGTTWPPALPTADKNGVATLTGPELLLVPSSVKHILDSNSALRLTIAKEAPKVELAYFEELPSASFNGTGWSSWGDICIASDGKVYAGIGNHGGIEEGEAFIYCWDPSTRDLKKIADLNEITGASPGEVHFSKVHAHIIEGKDKKIYFTGTLDDGGKAGSEPILSKWTEKIAGGKLFQYDPATSKNIVYADFPKARVTATTKYDAERNLLYCALEGDPAYNDGFALGVFDMNKKEWIYQGVPGQIGMDRNFILDAKGNLYFNGRESFAHTGVRLKSLLEAWEKDQAKFSKADEGKLISASMLPGIKRRLNKEGNKYTTLWKYDLKTNSVMPTNAYFKSAGFRSDTRETKDGYIYGATMGGELFRYSPSKDQVDLLGSNFLTDGEYITVCDLSPDEKYLYYLPGAHGSAGFSGTPVIQYNIEKGEQKALAFLHEPMNKAFNYAPGGTYGIKVTDDGSTLYVGLNGSPSDSLRPKELGAGFGLTSFAIIHIPLSERSEK
ncbi:MAG: hypothetical protein JNL51_07435 [Chitinophagaceae bacterium]|nr:hypothetical protein [Chitinophagaceae bacterium]